MTSDDAARQPDKAVTSGYTGRMDTEAATREPQQRDPDRAFFRFLTGAVGILTAGFWASTGLAAWSMTAGNPTAINGVIGIGFWAVVLTAVTALTAWGQRS